MHTGAPWGMLVLATCWVLGIMFMHVDMMNLASTIMYLQKYLSSSRRRCKVWFHGNHLLYLPKVPHKCL